MLCPDVVPPDGGVGCAMKRVWRWLVRLVGVAGVVLAVLLVLHVVVLPGVVQRVVVAKLREMGLKGASLEVRSITPWNTQVANVSLDEQGRVRVGSLGVLYTLPDLLRGRLGTIEVTGAEMELRLHDGQLDLGPLADFQAPEGGAGDELPFGRIELRASALLLDLEGQLVRMPGRGSIVNTGQGVCRVDFRAEAAGAAVHVSGTADTTTLDMDLVVEGEVHDLAAPLAVVPVNVAEFPGRAGGHVTFKVHAVRSGGDARASVVVEAKDVSAAAEMLGHKAFADGVSARVEAEVALGPRVSALSGEVKVGELSVDGHVARTLRLTFAKADERLTFAAAADGGGWALTELKGQVAGLFGLIEGKRQKVEATASWSLGGRLPVRAIEILAAKGIEVAGLGKMAVTGRVAAQFVPPADPKGTWTWSARVPEMQATLAPGHVTLPRLGAVVRGVAASAQLVAEAGPERLSLDVLPGSRLALGEMAARVAGARLALSKGDEPSAEVTVGEKPARLVATLGEGAMAWTFAAPDVRATLRRGRAAARKAIVVVDGLEATARLRVAADASKATVDLLTGTTASVGAMAARTSGVVLTKADAAAPLAKVAVGDTPASLSLALGGADGPTWQAAAPDVRLALAPVSAAAAEMGVVARGAAATARLRLAATPQRATVSVLAGSKAVVDALSTSGLGVRVTKVSKKAPLLVAQVGDQAATAVVTLDGEKLHWQAACRARLALDKANVATADGSVRANALTASLPVRLEATPREAKLFHEGTWDVAVGALEAKAGGQAARVLGVRLTAGGKAKQPVATLALGGREIGLKAAIEARSAGPVSITAGEGISATLASWHSTLEASRNRAGARVHGDVAVEGIGGDVRRATADGAIEAHTQGGRLHVALDGRGTTGDWAEVPLAATFDLAVGKSRAVVSGSFGKANAGLTSAKVTGRAGLEDGLPVVEAMVGFAGAVAQSAEYGVRVSGVSAEVPVSFQAAPTGIKRLGAKRRRAARPAPKRVGKFAVGAIQVRNNKLPGLSGTVNVADWRADFTATWPLLPQAVLGAKGWLDVGSGVALGEVEAHIPRFEIKDEKELAGLLADAEGIDLSGAFALDAHLRLLADRVVPSVTFTTEGMRLASKQYEAALEDVTGSVTIESLDPISTPGNQRFTVARAHLGKLEVESGSIAFRIESPRSIFIERTEWGWASGRLYTHALRFDPSARAVDLVVYGDHLNLGDILAHIPGERATGEGSLYGRLPVTVRWPKLSYGNGFLYATPGTGSVRVADAEFVGKLLDSQDPRFASDDRLKQVKERIIVAVRDFEYSTFKTDLINRDGKLFARIHTSGKGRKNGQVCTFDLNLNGIDEALESAIMTKRELEDVLVPQ